MENLTIDDESLKQIRITTEQGVYRKFAMVFKGTQHVLGLKVFKKGSQESLSMKATEMKNSLRGNKAICGLIQGDKKEKSLMFMVPGTEDVMKKMGIDEKSYICSVNPYPAENLKKNIKNSNANFNKAEFKIVDSTDDPIFSAIGDESVDESGDGDALLEQWESVKSDVDKASFYLRDIWDKTIAVARENPDQIDTQWKIFEDANKDYKDFLEKVTGFVLDFMDADDEQKSVFVETIKTANDEGIYDTSKLEAAIET